MVPHIRTRIDGPARRLIGLLEPQEIVIQPDRSKYFFTAAPLSLALLSALGAHADPPALTPPTSAAVAAMDALASSNSGDLGDGYVAPDPASTASPPAGPLALINGSQITVRKFEHLEIESESGTLHYSGGVELDAADVKTGNKTGITADDVVYNPAQGDISVRGHVRAVAHGLVNATRVDGYFSGDEAAFNLISGTGFVTDAVVISDYVRMRGRRIEALPDGSIQITDGSLTTCIKGRPDYEVRAHQLNYTKQNMLRARRVTFYAGRTRLITLPTFHRNFAHSGPAASFTPGYNRRDGVTLRAANTSLDFAHESYYYDMNFNLRRVPTGLAAMQRDLERAQSDPVPRYRKLPDFDSPLRPILEELHTPTYREYTDNLYEPEAAPRNTAYAALQNLQYTYNRRVNNLQVSRFPEVGVRLYDLFGMRPRMHTPAELERHPLLARTGRASLLLDADVSLAEIIENPGSTAAVKLGGRVSLASAPLFIGRRIAMRGALSNWLGLYSSGTAYSLLSPQIELDYMPTRTSVLNVGYNYFTDLGHTPFQFDRRDVRHEMRLQYQVSGPYAFGYLSKYDIERSRFYDYELAVIRNLDCLQIGFVYRGRSQSFNLVFNILPPIPSANRRSMPLP